MAIPVNPQTNQLMNATGVLSNVIYDGNGNLIRMTNNGGSGLLMNYDEKNRVASAKQAFSNPEVSLKARVNSNAE